jgi:hypothetical protein
LQVKCFQEKHTLSIELGALVEDTSTVSTGARADQVGQETTTKARVDISGVTGVGGLVAARQLSLVTALGLGLLDSHAAGDVPADTILVLGAKAIGTGGLVGRKGDSQGGEAKENGADGELHFDDGE